MARPIKETPVLYGKDAERFLKEVDQNLKRDHKKEFIRCMASAERLKRRLGDFPGILEKSVD